MSKCCVGIIFLRLSHYGSPVFGEKRPKHEGHYEHKGEERAHLTGIYSFETFVSFVVEIDLPLRTVDPSF
jgi:hypothetical protein